MFTILIAPENLEKIRQVHTLPEAEYNVVAKFVGKRRYFITDYVPTRGPIMDWTILPEFLLKKHFEFDADKIKTDWDFIVRKP